MIIPYVPKRQCTKPDFQIVASWLVGRSGHVTSAKRAGISPRTLCDIAFLFLLIISLFCMRVLTIKFSPIICKSLSLCFLFQYLCNFLIHQLMFELVSAYFLCSHYWYYTFVSSVFPLPCCLMWLSPLQTLLLVLSLLWFCCLACYPLACVVCWGV